MRVNRGRLVQLWFSSINMKDKKSLRAHIVKGQPIFRRHLYISSALFVIIILVITIILIGLAMGYSKDRINAEMSAASESLAQQIRDQIQSVNLRLGTSSSETEFQRNTEIKSFLEGLVGQQEELHYIFVQDLRGEILWSSVKRGMELEQNQFSKVLISPRNSRPPKKQVTALSNPNTTYTDLIEPILLNDQPQMFAHFGIDQNLLEGRFAKVQGSILNRIILGSSVVVAILSLALFYVLWLLKRAQVVEAEAHEADRLAYLGTLAGGLAHEIRNPLSAINLNLQMIEEDLSSGETDFSELNGLLKGTKQEIKRLERLATNFLFYAKPLGFEEQEFDVSELLDDIASLVAREYEGEGIRLSRQDTADCVKVRGDRDLLKQAVLNLIVNAQDAVKVRADGQRCVTLGAALEDHQIVIRVEDNGPGVRPEEAQNLFKLFYSGKRGGTGLGLPIAQRIVESHGGTIDWRNRPEGGAEFSIRLEV